MADHPIIKHKRIKNYGLALGSFIIAFILGTMLVLPLFDKRTGFDVLSSMLGSESKNGNSLSDEPKSNVTLKPYIYWQAPPDSFGIESSKDVNVTFYRNWLNTTVVWSLQKSTDSVHWLDCTKLLVIKKDWNPINLSEKHTLSWVSDEDAYYQLLLKTDDVKTYQDMSASKDSKQDRMLLNYSITSTEDYNIYYDWSDYSKSAEASKTIMSKSVDVVSSKQQFSWKVYTNVKLGKDEKFSIDPTFGYSPTVTVQYLRSGGKNYMRANFASPASSGKLDNITFKFGTTSNSNTLQCALYNYVDYSSGYIGTLINTTETKAYTSSSDNLIFVFNFSSPKPTVTAGINYYMVICSTTDSGVASDYIRCEATSAGAGHSVTKTIASGISWDSPMTGEASVDYNMYIYGSYTVSAPSNTAPTITANSQNPKNQSTNVGLSLAGNYSHFNITISDANDATQNMNITWSTNESGSWLTMGTNTSVNNGTYYCTNVSWVDTYSHKYWWRVSVNDGCGGWANATYYFTTAAPSMSWHTINTWNGSLYNQSYFNQISLFNGTIYNESAWYQVNLWNGTIYNTAIGYQEIATWNGSIYNQSNFNLIQLWNGSIFNTSNYKTITLWNGSIYNQSAYHLIQEFNGTIYNTSIGFVLVQEWNGSLYNQSLWNQVSLWNGSLFNTSAYTQINLWNGTVYNQSGYHLINEYNGSIFNISIGFVLIKDWNGTVWNQSNWNQIDLWNGTVYNASNYYLIQDWNGTLYNQSQYYLIDQWNGSLYNVSIGFVLIDDWNGSIWNQSSWQDQEWNGSIYNASSYYQINNWNGSLYNQSTWHQISLWNGSLYNISIGFVLVTDWNGTIWNQSAWHDIEWNGTIYNASNFALISLWNGSLYNQSSYHLIQELNGTIYNISIGFIQVNNWNGTIYNQSSWQDIEWNGSIYNTSGYNQISLWNGTLFNQSTYHLIQEYNGTIYNTSIGFILINNWNGSVYNQSTWNLIQNWNGSICNQTTSNLIQEWNGSIYNASQSNPISTWNGSIYNTSSFNTISNWNGTIFNSSSFNLVNQWNGSIYNQSSYNQVEQWNGTIYNISIGFVLVQNWNGSIYNQSSWMQVSLWNGTVFNTSAFETINNWNGTVYNQSQAHAINLWNGTIFNVSGMIQIQDWNGTIFNASTFNQIILWNGTIFNTTLYVQINLWNGSIWNTTGAFLIQEWNGSIYNGTGLGAIITISNPYPGNNSNHIKINVTLSITINHLNGNQMNITWYWGNSSANATHYLGSTLSVINGTYSMAIVPANQTYTDYWWNVNVTSGTDYAVGIYNFKTSVKSGGIIVADKKFVLGLCIGILLFFVLVMVMRSRKRND